MATPGRAGAGKRACFSTISYLLAREECGEGAHGYLHRNKSEITHFWHAGLPLRYVLLDGESDAVREVVLGPRVDAGQVVQFTVPSGWWKATELVLPPDAHPTRGDPEREFGLLSEAVGPAFDYADMNIATEADVKLHHAARFDEFAKFVRPQGWVRPSPREPGADSSASQ